MSVGVIVFYIASSILMLFCFDEIFINFSRDKDSISRDRNIIPRILLTLMVAGVLYGGVAAAFPYYVRYTYIYRPNFSVIKLDDRLLIKYKDNIDYVKDIKIYNHPESITRVQISLTYNAYGIYIGNYNSLKVETNEH